MTQPSFYIVTISKGDIEWKLEAKKDGTIVRSPPKFKRIHGKKLSDHYADLERKGYKVKWHLDF